MRLWQLLGVCVSLATLAFACGSDGAGETPTTGDAPTSSAIPTPTSKKYDSRPEVTIDPDKKYVAIVETVKGTFRIELRPDLAIQTVNSFIFLAREGYYDGVTFHRVIPGFMAQGGDPSGTGSGDPGYTLPAEFSDVPYERGVVGMARTTDPNSGGSQFFITYTDQPNLNGQYTVFGKVVEGMKVVNALTPRDPATDPAAPPGDAIISIEIEEG